MTGAEYEDSRLPERFWNKVAMPSEDSDCWVWTGSHTSGGYGNLGWLGSTWYAHRVSYTVLVGAISEELEIDHLCRVRDCVNPMHLEPVTGLENMRRGSKGEMLTHCPAGHRHSETNTYVPGSKKCAECCKARARARYASDLQRSRAKANARYAANPQKFKDAVKARYWKNKEGISA